MKLIDDKMADDLFESLGLRLIAKEKQDEILTRLLELISKRAGIRIVEDFSDQETGEFNKIPKDDLEQMEDFMIAKNSKAKEIFEEEAGKVKEKLLNVKI